MARKVFRCGVIGYGGAFSMGNAHLTSLSKNAGMVAAAICELDPKRRKVAAEEWPEATVYERVGDMLRHAELDLATVITPHNTHAPLALQCLDAKVGVVLEKPLALTGTEVKDMIALAKRRKVMLSCFHNRRWDGDFMVLRDLIRKEKIIGRVFRIECGGNGYGVQPDWWRNSRKISGGAIYDWGAHFTDWVLNIVTAEIDWERRHRLMRMHTCLHLLSAVLDYPVTGGQVSDGKGRLDFDIPEATLDKEHITDELNRLIGEDHAVTSEWITDEELATQPDLVKTMSVKPPSGLGRVRLLRVGEAIDLQPCGGTHVRSTAEIGAVRVRKIENKGRHNRRVSIEFA